MGDIRKRNRCRATVAIHERIGRITLELLSEKRMEPSRVVNAKRAGTIASVVEADQYRARTPSGSNKAMNALQPGK